MYEFRLDISSPTGTKEAEVTNFLSLAATTAVNSMGVMSFELPISHKAVPFLRENSRLDLYFHDPNPASFLEWTPFFGGVLRNQVRDYSKQNRLIVSAYSYMWMLATRVIAYHSSYENRSKFTALPAETIMKQMVRYNLTADATVSNGRLLDGTVWPSTVVIVEPDEGRGDVRTWYCAQDGLHESLFDLAKIAGGDFDLIPLVSGLFEFRFYPGQRGANKQSTVVFSMARGNMGKAVYSETRVGEATVVLVGGQGNDAAREFQVRQSDEYNGVRHIEIFQSATQVVPGDIGGLNAEGDKKLADRRAKKTFEFEILQTPATRYAVHYGLGDIVMAVNPYNDESLPQKIRSADLVLEPGDSPQLVVKAENV